MLHDSIPVKIKQIQSYNITIFITSRMLKGVYNTCKFDNFESKIIGNHQSVLQLHVYRIYKLYYICITRLILLWTSLVILLSYQIQIWQVHCIPPSLY